MANSNTRQPFDAPQTENLSATKPHTPFEESPAWVISEFMPRQDERLFSSNHPGLLTLVFREWLI